MTPGSFLSHPLSNWTVSAFAKQLNEAHWKFRRGIHHVLDPFESVSFLICQRVGFQQRIIATSDSPWFIIRVFHSQPSCPIVDFVQPVLGAKSSDLRHTRSLEISGPCQAPWTSLVPSFYRISKTTATFRSDNFGRYWTFTYAVAYNIYILIYKTTLIVI